MEIIAIILVVYAFSFIVGLKMLKTQLMKEVGKETRKAYERERIMEGLDEPLKPRIKEDPVRVAEKDPFLREIWAAGYSHIRMFSGPEHSWELIKGGRVLKTIYSKDFIGLTVKDNGGHRWLSDADGSAEKFRKLIK